MYAKADLRFALHCIDSCRFCSTLDRFPFSPGASILRSFVGGTVPLVNLDYPPGRLSARRDCHPDEVELAYAHFHQSRWMVGLYPFE